MSRGTAVGRLLCQRNPFARSVRATVVSIEPHQPPAATPPSGKSAKAGTGKPLKDAEAPAANGPTPLPRHEIILSDTVLFPTGGGQPHDLGTINGLKVVDVLRRGLECVHVVEVEVESAPAIAVGDSVDVELDWARRWDHMQQHSGQHLLSAIAEKEEHGLVTVAWAYGRDVCYIEVESKEKDAPSVEVLELIEVEVNEAIRAAVPMKVIEEEDGQDRPDTLPGDITEGVVRYVEIEGIDRNPCCGTHLTTTAALQCVKILPWTEKVRGKNHRISFLFGDRVIGALNRSLLRERALGSLLSTGPDMLVDKVTGLSSQLKAAGRHTKALIKDLTHLLAHRMLLAARKAAGANTADRPPVITYHRDDADADLVTSLQRSLTDSLASSPPLPSPVIFLLSAGDVKAGGSVSMFGLGPGGASSVGCAGLWTDFVGACGGEVKGGGGGKDGRYQGKATGWKKRVEALKAVGAIEVGIGDTYA
ncbi:Alanyl-tRNA editing protein Aarsd1 [Irineochytrium annulatum]|nr:Alanyl-tRNA editing protein Aarsd1 [Irineochytrium annulatum]